MSGRVFERRDPSTSAVDPVLVIGVVALLCLLSTSAGAQDVENGEELYETWCVECHGAEGAGDGPAADRMLPRPRDFTTARYQIRTTGSGALPTDEDIMAVLRDGIPGTTMPGWPNLSESDHEDLTAYLKSLSRFFEGADPEPMEFGDDPGASEELLEAGREAYQTLECYNCHGQEGRGDGSSSPTLEDSNDRPIRAADLTEPWLFNGGSSPEAVHRRFLTGLDGTPMPAYSDALQTGLVSEDDLWGLAHYVRSLAPEQVPPRVRDVIRVRRGEEEAPLDPTSPVWETADAHYIPLAGQVIERPRAFSPTVDGVWVRGYHDGERLALRIRWSDPSASPDSAWLPWQESMAATMDPDGTQIPTEPLGDALALQFPWELPEGNERPYFLMGDAQDPVYLWDWHSEEGVAEARATGLGTDQRMQTDALEGRATWDAGQWTVTYRRSLEAGSETALEFTEGAAVPVAFFAWDGSNGERDTRGSLSSWYFLILEEPASNAIYVAPLIAMLLTGGLGLLGFRRARSRADEEDDAPETSDGASDRT